MYIIVHLVYKVSKLKAKLIIHSLSVSNAYVYDAISEIRQ